MLHIARTVPKTSRYKVFTPFLYDIVRGHQRFGRQSTCPSWNGVCPTCYGMDECTVANIYQEVTGPEPSLPETTNELASSSKAIVHMCRGHQLIPRTSSHQYGPSLEKSERVEHSHVPSAGDVCCISQDWHLYDTRLALHCGTGTPYGSKNNRGRT